jgi:polyhydroxybutyrate depolymerase
MGEEITRNVLWCLENNMRHRINRRWTLIVGTMLLIQGMWGLHVVHGAEAKVLVPGDHPVKLTLDGIKRHYTVHVPPSCAGRSLVPVVMMLHGGGGTGRAAAYETGWAAKADEAGFLAVFPDAVPRAPSKPASFALNPQLWNDGSDRFYQGQKQVDDVGFLNAVFDDLLARFAANPKRIYVTGFSNGASMAFRFGAEASGRVAAIAPVAGACWLDPLKLHRPVPMCYITGTADSLNLIEGGVPKLATGASDKVRAKPKPPVRASVEKWAKAIGCPTTPTKISDAGGVHRENYGPGPEGMKVLYITVEDMGHTWAGGKSLLPEIMVGKRSDRFHATDAIWGFFQEYSVSTAR